MSIKTKDYRFVKNGKYHLILAGEIHYFRLPKESWEMHLDIAKLTGINTIATYVPWIIHEEIYRQYEFSNDYDLAHFITLCKKKNLDVILKPGPFIMAELKNEGLPYWLYEKYPEIIPKTWENRAVTTPMIDYLHPTFLKEIYVWYQKLINILSPFINSVDNPIVGIQLDNEVGMLSWVSNQPELTKDIISSLKAHLPSLVNPYHPAHDESLIYHDTLETLMRKRYESYIQKLKAYFKELGLKDILYFINIHGTSNGRGKNFPIGVSQLIDTYKSHADIYPGLDLYFGNIDIENFHDLYIVNAFVKSTSKDLKPYGTLELNVADGNFGDNLAIHLLPSSIDFKIRLALIQDQKFLNYYLLTAGINPKLKAPKADDLNQRVAITGARHGYAAPIRVDGSLLYTYDILKKTTQMINNFTYYLSSMKEQTDDIVACFMMDSYKTEYHMPSSDTIQKKNDNLSLHRNSVYWDTLLKQMLLLNYSFKSFWIEGELTIDPAIKLFITNTSTYMSTSNQEKIVEYLKTGGKVIFVGDLPTKDLFGQDQTTLIDYLNLKPVRNYYDWEDHLLTLTSDVEIYGQNEFRSFIAQSIKTDEKPLFRHLITKEAIGVKSKQYVWITSNYPGHLVYTKDILDHLNIQGTLTIKKQKGFILSFKQSYQDINLYHLINLEHFKQSVTLYENEIVLFDNHQIDINAQEALMLWTNIRINQETFIYLTGEIQSYTKDSYTLNIDHKTVYLKIRTDRKLINDSDVTSSYQNGVYEIIIKDVSDQIVLKFQ